MAAIVNRQMKTTLARYARTDITTRVLEQIHIITRNATTDIITRNARTDRR